MNRRTFNMSLLGAVAATALARPAVPVQSQLRVNGKRINDHLKSTL